MKNIAWIASVVLAGGLLAGCQSDDYDNQDTSPQDYGNRAGRLTPADRMEMGAQRDPYPAIKGDTTGDGMRRDRRAGGAVTGDDVTRGERIRGNEPTPVTPADQTPARNNISTDPVTGSGTRGGVGEGTSTDNINPIKNNDPNGTAATGTGVPTPNTGGR